MEKEAFENFLQAGKIAAEVREASKSIVKDGIFLNDLAEQLEKMIVEKGGFPAFPVNLSLNNQAAHYTPSKNDKSIFRKDDVLKIDLGVHVDGYVSDTAYTISFNDANTELIKASKEALDAALELCRPGKKLADVSGAIEDTIRAYNFRPISNLSGHGLGRFVLHKRPGIPNVRFNSDYVLKEDEIFAVEPFATDGDGFVKDSEEVLIFMFKQQKPVRNPDARKITTFIQQYGGLPFAQRWVENGLNFSEFKIKLAIRELVGNDTIHAYPVLLERKDSLVSQHEHTVIVKEDPIITTK